MDTPYTLFDSRTDGDPDAELQDICGETFDHDEVTDEVIDGVGYYRCRRCDAEWWDEASEEDGQPSGLTSSRPAR